MPTKCRLAHCQKLAEDTDLYGETITRYCRRHAYAYSNHYEGNHDGECGSWSATNGCAFC